MGVGVGVGASVDGGKEWFCFGDGCKCVSANMRKYVLYCIG